MWVRRDDGDETLLVISAPEGTPLGHALGAMAEATGRPGRMAASIDGAPLPESTPLGSPPLVHGARIRLDENDDDDDDVDEPGQIRVLTGAGCLVRVVAGPGAGAEHRLPPGSYVLGRGEECHVRLADPGVSRRHALLRVGARDAAVADLGSSNGTFLGRARVGPRPVAVRRGVLVRMGATAWAVERADEGPPARGKPSGAGCLLVNRAPRAVPAARPVRLQRPRAAELPPPGPLPLLTLLLPPVVSLVAALLLRQPAFLLFGLMGPAMSLGTYWTDRRRHGRGRKRALQDYREALARHDARLAETVAVRRRELERSTPGAAEAVRACAARTEGLWQRNPADPDWLRLRIGRGRASVDVLVADPDGSQESPRLHDVPIAVSLAEAGVIGLAPLADPDNTGDAAHRALAGALLAQCVAWHGPSQLHVWVLAARAVDLARWRWLTQTPHVIADGTDPCGAFARVGSVDARGDAARRLRELTAILEQRVGGRAAPGQAGPSMPWHLVVLDGARELLEQPGTAELLRVGREAGFVALCLGSSASELPAECAQVVLVRADGLADIQGDAHEASDVTADLADDAALRLVGLGLAPLADGTPVAGDAVPDRVDLADILDVDPRVPGAVAQAWRRQGVDATVDVGRDTSGPVRLDLRRDGPHALVGGTTGSGKSELLRTLIASLALRNRPDRLCFVLVDYKGGSAFDACARLPHAVGVVTDLDGAASERALTGLRAELRRREGLLRAAGVADLEGYAAAVDGGARDPAGIPLRHLPRMVLVLDEFRALAEELPDFVAGVVRFAALGRALGIHLVLATQRPAGIVSADIRANVGLRIALRVRDAADSVDVVESPVAADLPARCPGRAVARSGGGPLLTFQTARLAAGASAPREVVVRPIPDGALGTPLEDVPVAGRGPLLAPSGGAVARGDLDLDNVVRATLDAAAALDVPLPAPPWLPALPERIAWNELAPSDAAPDLVATDRGVAGPDLAGTSLRGRNLADPSAGRHANAGDAPPRTPRPCRTPLRPAVLLDDPERQRRQVWRWEPASGHLAVVGRGRSGRTQALMTLATAAADAECPVDLALHVVDAGNGLRGLTMLPHAASHVTLGDPGALRRLVRGLRERVRTRAGAPRSRGHAPGGGQPSDGTWLGVDDRAPLPTDLVVIDGWDQLRALLEGLDHGAALEELVEAARGGATAGLSILAAGGRGLLTGGLASCFADRLVLDLSDPTDAFLAGLGAHADAGRPPGRAVLTSQGLVGQIALLDAEHHASPGHLPLDMAERITLRHAGCPSPDWGIRPLPLAVTLGEVRQIHGDPPPSTRGPQAWLGLAGDGGAVAVPLSGPGWLIAGPPGSGRTTALRTIAAHAAAERRPVLWCSAHPPAFRDDPDSPLAWCPPQGAPEVERLLRDPGAVVLVDDLEALTGSALDTLHSDGWVSDPRGACVIATGRTADLAGSFRGLAGALRRTGQGLVLGGGGRADEVFAVSLPRGEPDVPGRGTWVQDGRAQTVHVALV